MEACEYFRTALAALERALEHESKALADDFYFAGISKTFEVAVEYAWRYLRARVAEEGLDPYSPKEAIRLAGQIQIIDDVEAWMLFLNQRNLAVHNDHKSSPEASLKVIRAFQRAAAAILPPA